MTRTNMQSSLMRDEDLRLEAAEAVLRGADAACGGRFPVPSRVNQYEGRSYMLHVKTTTYGNYEKVWMEVKV